MEQEITIPERTVRKVSQHINIDVDNKRAYVASAIFSIPDGKRLGEDKDAVELNGMMTEEGFTNAEKLAVKKFFNTVIAKAWGIPVANLTADF